MNKFAKLLRQYRKASRDPHLGQPLTQERLAELLSHELGMSYTPNAIGNWERGIRQIHKDDRDILVALIQILHRCHGIQSLAEATLLLKEGNYRELDRAELQRIQPTWQADTSQGAIPDPFLTLPPQPYRQLFGRDEEVITLVNRLQEPSFNCLVAITGVGGVGKTALAYAVAKQLMTQGWYERLLWLSVDVPDPYVDHIPPNVTFESLIDILTKRLQLDAGTQLSLKEQIQQVRLVFQKHKFLVVIDNLEVTTTVHTLLKHLINFADSSKFLITGRIQPRKQADVFIFPLQELSLAASSALMRHHAQMVSVHGLQQVSDKALTTIYKVIGGNPQALRFTARLASQLPFDYILSELQKGTNEDMVILYHKIYHGVISTLDANAQMLLQSMLLITETGTSLDHLQAISNLNESELWSALTQLITRSLLDVRHEKEVRYRIHRLTETFLWTRINADQFYINSTK